MERLTVCLFVGFLGGIAAQSCDSSLCASNGDFPAGVCLPHFIQCDCEQTPCACEIKQCPEGTIFSISPLKCEDVQNVTECPSTSATSSPVTGPIDVPYQCEEDGSFPIENCSVSYIICVGCALENCTAYPEECPAGSSSTFHPVERKCSANNPYCSPTEETDPTTTTNLITSTSGIEVTASSTTETTFPITSPCSTSSDITNPTQSTAQTTDPDTPTRQPFDLSGELDNLQITVFIIIGVVGTIFVTMAVGIIVLYKVLDKMNVKLNRRIPPTLRFSRSSSLNKSGDILSHYKMHQ